MKLLRQGPQGTSRRRADPPANGAITWHSRSDALINGIAKSSCLTITASSSAGSSGTDLARRVLQVLLGIRMR